MDENEAKKKADYPCRNCHLHFCHYCKAYYAWKIRWKVCAPEKLENKRNNNRPLGW